VHRITLNAIENNYQKRLEWGVPTSIPAVRAQNISYSFDGLPVLHSVNLELRWGAVSVIAGPNGAGKSTLIEILAGVRTPQTGTVERAEDVALVVQRVSTPDALPLTVQDVVTMGTWGGPGMTASERRRRVAEALDRVHLAQLAGSPFNSLSGGQRQRALLAQGIARQARIFLLDEPAAGLDAESRARTRAMLTEEAWRGAAVACVSHDEESIAAADHLITVSGGRVLS
jgi:zinc/manganese transport system ATP-binding protein